ncbi:hypothetical protein BpHYR1_022703 [Brachionus plicatilis]|uniref:Uncharacterized protein n=1 Tax=Brachionus plicatilis TaxID=10195 RepID=A0A3M7T749_BRAPC|nr:hypothetical protein BpHYR1_022703 [Brachionus plicatilis]
MRFLVAIVALIVCVSAQNSRTKCTYTAETLSLVCKSPGGDVGCEAIAEFPLNFKIVGLGFDSKSADPQAVRLFGFKEGQTAWTHHTLNGNQMTMSTTATSGIRIRNQECLDKLMLLFKASSPSLDVPVDNAGVREKLSLFGESHLIRFLKIIK